MSYINFKIIIRNLLKNKFHFAINIIGLSIGISVFIIVLTYINNELSVDKFHKYFDQIYRLEADQYSTTPAGFGKVLIDNFDEIINFTSLCLGHSSPVINYKNNSIKIKNLAFADSSILNFFSFKIILGDTKNPLKEPNSLVINKSYANKIFGGIDPIGETVTFDNLISFKITAVIEDIPLTSSIQCDGFASIQSLKTLWNQENLFEDYDNWEFLTYLMINKKVEIESLEYKINLFLNKINGSDSENWINFYLLPFKNIYFNDHLNFDYCKHNSYSQIYILLCAAIFILFIAIANYINLSIVSLSKRFKEIGLKKIIGASKWDIILQFVIESIFLSFISALIAIFLANQILPIFNIIFETNINILIFKKLGNLLTFLSFIFILGFILGFFPPSYIYSFNPSKIMSRNIFKSLIFFDSKISLVLIQFTLSAILLTASLVLNKQIKYINKMDLGFSSKNIIYFPSNMEINKNWEAFHNDLIKISNINNIALSNSLPGLNIMQWERDIEEKTKRFYCLYVNDNFINLFNVKIKEGRNFSNALLTDLNTCIINESAVKYFELKSPINFIIDKRKIIGVTKDFHFRSLHNRIEPLILINNPYICSIINVKLTNKYTPETIESIKKIWGYYSPNYPFEFEFIDSQLRNLYNKELRIENLLKYITFLIILITLTGLYGLISFITEKRMKEIGIRKIHGATFINISKLISKEFLIIIILANLIAFPVSFFLIKIWIQNFAYHTNIGIMFFITTLFITMFITTLTIILKITKYINMNIIDVIKSE